MKLTSIQMVGFRRFRELAEIPVRGKLTALIGPNEAGKSTVLKALTTVDRGGPIDVHDVSNGLAPDRAKVELRFAAELDDNGLGGDYQLRVSADKAVSWGKVPGDIHSLLERRRPRLLSFDRSLRDVSDVAVDMLNSKTPPFWSQLLVATQQDPRELSAAVGAPHKIQTLQDSWNKKLKALFEKHWKKQSSAIPQVTIQGGIVHLLWSRGGQHTPSSWGSEGLRTYLALVVLLEAQRQRDGDRPVILLIDELEQSLHYSAQAEVVNMLQAQQLVRQVIYSTHSAGCLPSDVGRGVVALEFVNENESCVKKRIWDPSAKGGRDPDIGVWPLLMALGAGSLGFLAVRSPVFVEGFSDLIYLPEALRWASGEAELGIDFYPGLSQVSERHEFDLARRGKGVAFLLDGDAGGKERAEYMGSLGIPNEQLVLAPYEAVEDLVEPEVFREALGRVLQIELKAGNQSNRELLAMYASRKPSKAALAYEVIEAESKGEVWRSDCRQGLKDLLAKLRGILSNGGGEGVAQPSQP
jgi:hypothetical protein